MSHYWYYRDGTPIPGTGLDIGSKAWNKGMKEAESLLTNYDYKIVKQDKTADGKYWISTVWLGLDHDYNWMDDEPNPNPVIFETMVFENEQKTHELDGKKFKYREDLEQERYVTEEEARAGHKKWLDKYNKKEA